MSRAKLGASPDYVRFVAATREVWVTEPDAERIEIFAFGNDGIPAAKSVGVITVKGGPESLVIDSRHGRAYAHLWKGETVAIDLTRTWRIRRHWKNGCRGSRGIALDESRGFLFAGCAEGAAVVLSVDDGRELSHVSSGDGVDIIDYDAGSNAFFFRGERARRWQSWTSPPLESSPCGASWQRRREVIASPPRRRDRLRVRSQEGPAARVPRTLAVSQAASSHSYIHSSCHTLW